MKVWMAALAVVVMMAVTLSCTPKMSTKMVYNRPFSTYPENITVYGPYDTVPAQAVVLGSFKINGTGFSGNHDYKSVVEMAQDLASEKGGNALHVRKRTKPKGLTQVSINIEGDILWLDSLNVSGNE